MKPPGQFSFQYFRFHLEPKGMLQMPAYGRMPARFSIFSRSNVAAGENGW